MLLRSQRTQQQNPPRRDPLIMPLFSMELPKANGGLPAKSDAKKDSMEFIDNLDTYGTYKFKGKVAAPYLKAQGLPVDTLDNPMWTHTLSDKVAKAVVEWCKDKGATMATHWFQPLGSAGLRRGPMSNTATQRL